MTEQKPKPMCKKCKARAASKGRKVCWRCREAGRRMYICSVDGCTTSSKYKICVKHKKRLKKFGSYDKPQQTTTCASPGCDNTGRHKFCWYHRRMRKNSGRTATLETGFELMQRMLKEAGDTDQCVRWPKAIDRYGYGRIEWPHGPEKRVHRVSLIIATGVRGENTRHTCRNRNCFNPKHLRWGSVGDNAKDRQLDGTTARGERNGGGGKLTDSTALLVFQDKRRNVVIAKAFNISAALVSAIKRRKVWKHVTAGHTVRKYKHSTSD